MSNRNGYDARRQKKYLYMWIVISTVILALLILAAILIFRENTDLVGIWQYDQYTQYEFYDGHSGCMCLDESTHYAFSYRIKDNTLYIDFELNHVTDCQYTYTLDGNKLTLVGGTGTAEPGTVYDLVKVD